VTQTAGLAGWRSSSLSAAWPPLVLAGATVLASLVTYRDHIDGQLPPYAGSLALGALGAVVAAGWVMAARLPRTTAVVLSVLALLPAPLVHAVRVYNRDREYAVELRRFFDYGALLEPTLTDRAMLHPGFQELLIRAPSGSVGYVEIKLPATASLPWTLPRLLVLPMDPRAGEAVSWQGGIERDRVYFGLVDVDRVVAETTSWGLQITAPTATGAPAVSSVGLAMPDASPRDWTIRRAQGRLSLLAGDREVWSTADRGPFKVVRLGETRTDSEHGGALKIWAVRYARFRV
jgi:hypothetical protein